MLVIQSNQFDLSQHYRTDLYDIINVVYACDEYLAERNIISGYASVSLSIDSGVTGELTVVINGLRCAAVLNLFVPQKWCAQVTQVADTRPV